METMTFEQLCLEIDNLSIDDAFRLNERLVSKIKNYQKHVSTLKKSNFNVGDRVIWDDVAGHTTVGEILSVTGSINALIRVTAYDDFEIASYSSVSIPYYALTKKLEEE